MASGQLPLFEHHAFPEPPQAQPPARTGAMALVPIVAKKDGRPLTKHERALNRLIARVQVLRQQFDSQKRRLDDWLVLHAAEVPGRIQRVIAERKTVVRTLVPYLDDRRLSARDTPVLGRILMMQLDDILSVDQMVDPDLQALFARLHGRSVADVVQESIDDARAEMTEVFSELGLDLEAPNLRADMSDEEMSAEAARVAEELARLAEARSASERPPGRRTKRQAKEDERRRQMEQARKISIGAVYKRLVKALHPDVEPDPANRARKSALMQEVTVAYAQNDMHTLLRLELEWIGTSPTDAARLSDETMRAYVDALEQQVLELQMEIDALALHPRYAPLLVEDAFGWPSPMDVPAEIQRLDTLIAALADAGNRLGSGSIRAVRDLVKETRQRERLQEFAAEFREAWKPGLRTRRRHRARRARRR